MEEQWQNALACLVARVKELGRLPTGNGPTAKWMYVQRRALREGRLCESRERALNETVPGWNKVSSSLEREQKIDKRDSTVWPPVSEQAGM